MDRSPPNTLGDLCRTDNLAPVVKYLHEVILLNAPVLCVLRIDPYDPVIVTVNADPVVFDVVDEAALAVIRSKLRNGKSQRFVGRVRDPVSSRADGQGQ